MWRETTLDKLELGEEFIAPELLPVVDSGYWVRCRKLSNDGMVHMPQQSTLTYVQYRLAPDTRVLVEVTEAAKRLNENIRGASDAIKEVVETVTQECSDCKGSGKYQGLFTLGDCSRCNGSGVV